MAKKQYARNPDEARRRLIYVGVACLVLGATLLAGSFFLAANPRLAPVAQGLRSGAPWALLVGALTLFLHFVIGRAAAPSPRTRGPTFFDRATTSFHDEAIDEEPGPRKPGR